MRKASSNDGDARVELAVVRAGDCAVQFVERVAVRRAGGAGGGVGAGGFRRLAMGLFKSATRVPW